MIHLDHSCSVILFIWGLCWLKLLGIKDQPRWMAGDLGNLIYIFWPKFFKASDRIFFTNTWRYCILNLGLQLHHKIHKATQCYSEENFISSEDIFSKHLLITDQSNGYWHHIYDLGISHMIGIIESNKRFYVKESKMYHARMMGCNRQELNDASYSRSIGYYNRKTGIHNGEPSIHLKVVRWPHELCIKNYGNFCTYMNKPFWV